MRVVYFSQDYTTHDYRFLEKLAQTSHEVWYIRFETNPNPSEMRPVPSGIKVLDWMGNKTFKLRGWDKLKLYRDFKKSLYKLNPDLIHTGPTQNCGFFTALAGYKPMLLMSWGSDIMAKPDKNAIMRWITKFTIKRADMIVCDCQAVRDKIIELTRYPSEKIAIFPWGVNLKQFHPATSKLKLRDKLGWKKKRIIINTRSLEHIYGVEIFLEAALKVIRMDPDCRILMMGNGSLEAKVRHFIAQHNLEHSIHLTGRIPHDTIPDYFNEADLYVSSSYSDGTSVSLLEAMACNLPVIVTDLPSNREWVTNGINGWLVPVGDAQALSIAITEALNQGNRVKLMTKVNLATVNQRANWDKNFAILMEVYKRLAFSGGHH